MESPRRSAHCPLRVPRGRSPVVIHLSAPVTARSQDNREAWRETRTKERPWIRDMRRKPNPSALERGAVDRIIAGGSL